MPSPVSGGPVDAGRAVDGAVDDEAVGFTGAALEEATAGGLAAGAAAGLTVADFGGGALDVSATVATDPAEAAGIGAMGSAVEGATVAADAVSAAEVCGAQAGSSGATLRRVPSAFVVAAAFSILTFLEGGAALAFALGFATSAVPLVFDLAVDVAGFFGFVAKSSSSSSSEAPLLTLIMSSSSSSSCAEATDGSCSYSESSAPPESSSESTAARFVAARRGGIMSHSTEQESANF